MASIYLFRHGQASFGTDHYDRLSELGQQQACVLGQHLRDCGVQFDAAYAGSLDRQQHTARLALASQMNEVPLTTDERFNEVGNDEQIEALLPLLMEQRPEIKALVESGLDHSKTFQKIIEAVFNLWVSPDCPQADIQSWDDFSSGTRSAIEMIMREHGGGKNIAVFTSGGTIATITAQVLGLGGEQTYQLYEPVINCSITKLLYSAEKVSVSHFNDHSYLFERSEIDEKSLVTYR